MAKNHVHKYILQDIGKDKVYLVYRCFTCPHYRPAAEVIGVDTICWRCGEVCQIPKMRKGRYIKRPHCLKCTKVYKGTVASSQPIDLEKLANMSIEDLLNDDSLFNPEKNEEH